MSQATITARENLSEFNELVKALIGEPWLQVSELVLAAAIAVFAYRQFRISKSNVAASLYDKRFKVYEAYIRLLDEIIWYKRVSDEHFREIQYQKHHARILFGTEIESLLLQADSLGRDYNYEYNASDDARSEIERMRQRRDNKAQIGRLQDELNRHDIAKHSHITRAKEMQENAAEQFSSFLDLSNLS